MSTEKEFVYLPKALGESSSTPSRRLDMNTKHTPGPWTIKDYDFGQYEIGAKGLVVATALNDVVELEHQAEANAKLIATAPELLETVKMFLDWLNSEVVYKHIDESRMPRGYEKAFEVYNKAIGNY